LQLLRLPQRQTRKAQQPHAQLPQWYRYRELAFISKAFGNKVVGDNRCIWKHKKKIIFGSRTLSRRSHILEKVVLHNDLIVSKSKLSTKNVDLNLPCKKLSPAFVGPFTIRSCLGTNAVRLNYSERF
jgi:hypothetical protein